jgi:hypothetical protein
MTGSQCSNQNRLAFLAVVRENMYENGEEIKRQPRYLCYDFGLLTFLYSLIFAL